MSKKSSFKAAIERQAPIAAGRRSQSDFPAVKLLLSAGEIARPVDLIRLLVRSGQSMKKARAVVDRLAEGSYAPVQLSGASDQTLMVELKALGVTARRFAENQTIDVKNIREAQHLSQSEFALLYQLELDTLQNWEQGRYAPDNSSTVLLKVIQRRPDAVLDALTEEPQATESNI